MNNNGLNTLKQALDDTFLKDTGLKQPRNAEQRNEARRVFSVVNAYFFEIYGELWLSRVAGDDQKKNWCLHLLGLSLEDVAKGISNYCYGANAEFPPNPLQFRGLCLKAASKAKHETIQETRLQVLN